MKKSLIALAVLAASGASFAQSSVTVYGLLDIWGGSVKTESGGASLTNTVLVSGGVNGSRWGLKGSEDLGGGLKANFLLEQGLSIDTGAGTAGQAFSRNAYVGFSGGFGEIKLGKPWTAYDDVSGASNAVFDSALAPMNAVFASTGYNGNPGNTIYYATPTLSGFAGAVSYSLGENKTAAIDAGSVFSFNVQYAAGPLSVALAYQEDKFQNGTLAEMDPITGVVTPGAAATAVESTKYTRLGASYDLGVVAVKGTYGKVTYTGNSDTTEYQIGLDYPVSSALTLSGSYAKSDDSNAAGFEPSRKGYGFAAAYTLSKRTFVYGGFRTNSETVANSSDDKATVFAVGVQHKF